MTSITKIWTGTFKSITKVLKKDMKNMKSNDVVGAGACGLIVIYLVVAGALSVGWFMNAYALTQCDFEAPYKAEALRGVGIVAAPLGGILGFIPIEDGVKDEL